MAQSDDSMELFKTCPTVFQEVLVRFRVCHDVCVYTSKEMLAPGTLNKVDQCAVDFRHMSMQTASLADKMSSIWCKTCLLFFKNLEKINMTRIDTMLKRISSQAKDLSVGFKTIGKWCRELAGRFHEAQKLATQNTAIFQEEIHRAEQEADKLTKELTCKLEKLEIEAQEKREDANKWSGYASIPLFGYFFKENASMKDLTAVSAEESLKRANTESENAKRTLLKTRDKQEKAKVRYN